MKYWLVTGSRSQYDHLVVAADTLKLKDRMAIFESNKGNLVAVLNTEMWSSILPMTVDQYFASSYPILKQGDNE